MTSTAAGARPSPGSSRMPPAGAARAGRPRQAPVSASTTPTSRARARGGAGPAPVHASIRSAAGDRRASRTAASATADRPTTPKTIRGRSGTGAPAPPRRRPASRASGRACRSARVPGRAPRASRPPPAASRPQVGLELDRAVGGCPAPPQPRVVVPLGGEEAFGGHHEGGWPGAGSREGVEEALAPQAHRVVQRVDRDGGADLQVEVAHGADEQHRHRRRIPLRRVAAAVAASCRGQARQPGAAGGDRSSR